jgi:hypothetical protein
MLGQEAVEMFNVYRILKKKTFSGIIRTACSLIAFCKLYMTGVNRACSHVGWGHSSTSYKPVKSNIQ